MWLFLLALHLVGLTGYNLLLRKSILEKIDKFTLATVMQTGIAIPAVLIPTFSAIDASLYSPRVLLIMVIYASMVAFFHYTQVKAMQYLEASVFSVLYNLRILFTTFLGIVFLGEELIWLRILGGLFILAAIFIVKQKGSKSVFSMGMHWGILAGLLVSFMNMTEKAMIKEIGYGTFFTPVMILSAGILWTVLILRKQKTEYGIFIQPNMLKLMSLRILSAYAFTLAFAAGGLLSVSSYISSLSVILIVVFGVLWLGERDYLRRKIWSTVVAVIGLTIILVSGLL